MLVLTRKNHESIVVEDASRFDHVLKVTVLDVKGRKVKLGFEAQADVSIHRSELLQRMRGGRSDCGNDSSGSEHSLAHGVAVQ